MLKSKIFYEGPNLGILNFEYNGIKLKIYDSKTNELVFDGRTIREYDTHEFMCIMYHCEEYYHVHKNFKGLKYNGKKYSI